jgi:hypothetical protein
VSTKIAALGTAEVIKELLAEFLAYEPEGRPDVASLDGRLEALAEQMGGPSLRRWAKARRWPAPAAFNGELDGQQITETLSLDLRATTRTNASASAAAEPRLPSDPSMTLYGHLDEASRGTTESGSGGSKWLLLAVLGLGFVGALMVGVGVLGVLVAAPSVRDQWVEDAQPAGSGALSTGTDETPEGLPEEPEGTPDPTAVPADSPGVPPEAPIEAPGTPVIPAVVPIPAQPTEPSPKPTPSVGAVGTVRFRGDATALALVGAAGTFPAGEVPPGRYRVDATFPGVGVMEAGRVTVAKGRTIVLSCRAGFYRCDPD